MKTKGKLLFANLPREYAALCRLHLPRPIHDRAEYENTLEVAEAFAGFEALMNDDQNDYFDCGGAIKAGLRAVKPGHCAIKAGLRLFCGAGA